MAVRVKSLPWLCRPVVWVVWALLILMTVLEKEKKDLGI